MQFSTDDDGDVEEEEEETFSAQSSSLGGRLGGRGRRRRRKNGEKGEVDAAELKLQQHQIGSSHEGRRRGRARSNKLDP